MDYFDPAFDGMPFLAEILGIRPALIGEKLLENAILVSKQLSGGRRLDEVRCDSFFAVAAPLRCTKTRFTIIECYFDVAAVDDVPFLSFASKKDCVIALDAGIRSNKQAIQKLSEFPYLHRSRYRLAQWVGKDIDAFAWSAGVLAV